MTVESLSPIRFVGVSNVTATPGDNDPEVGTRFREGDEDYIYVYNDGNTNIEIGEGAVISANTGYSVTVSSVTGTHLLIGVCKHTTFTSDTYGCLMTRGWAPVEFSANNSAAVGDRVSLGTDGLFANGSDGDDATFGQAFEAIASGASGNCYFDVS